MERYQDQRQLPELRAYIDTLLAKGWVIASRNPLTLQAGRKTYQVTQGMLIGSSIY
ncbi:hypothetical protein WG219_01475 [Ectopseudomonas mendocina]|uniref:Uncharacterized protein n=1 Tax=Ectopseudomonas mendocina TaxID=300 RepID=A0ABZ2RHC7_ECTME